MRNKRGFTLIELLVVVAIIALLSSVIMPALKMAKITANRVMCRANLRQWGVIWKNYTTDFDDKMPHGNWGVGSIGESVEEGTWLVALTDYYESYKIRFCPTAVKDNKTENGSFPFMTWGPRAAEWQEEHPNHWRSTIYFKGSYGINDFAHLPTNINKVRKDKFALGPDYENKFWGTPNVRNGSEVPVMIDSVRFKIRPKPTNLPPPTETNMGPSSNGWLRYACVNRHKETVNSLFLDWSVRSVGLKELWVLEWYRGWEAVIPDPWPKWMERMEDYQ